MGKGADIEYKAPEEYRFFSREVFPEKKARIAELQQHCKQLISDCERKNRAFRVAEDMAEKMADLVVAKALLSRNATRRGGILAADRMDPYVVKDMDKVNDRIRDMRQRILNDSTFLSEIQKGGSSRDFYDRYKNAKKRELDLLTSADSIDGNNSEYDKLPVKLTASQNKMISHLIKQLDEVNGHKRREGLNAGLMDALSTVENNSRRNDNLTFNDLAELNQAAASYYTSRRGLFFGPVTDDGKDRLEIAGQVYEMTKQILDQIKLKQMNQKIELEGKNKGDKKIDNKAAQEVQQAQQQALARGNEEILAENNKVLEKIKTGLDDRLKNGLKEEEKNIDVAIKYAAMAYASEDYKDNPLGKDAGGYERKLKNRLSEIRQDPDFKKALGDAVKEPFDIKKIVETATARNEKGELKIKKAMEDIKKTREIEQSKKDKAPGMNMH